MQPGRTRDWIARPGPGVGGTVVVPGDKSISHRALMLGGIADGDTEIHGFLDSADCLATLAAMRAMGVAVDTTPEGALLVHGVGLRGLKAPPGPLDMGNAGTAMRLFTGLLAGQGFDSVLVGDASLMRRPMERVAVPLRLMGARIDTEAAESVGARVLTYIGSDNFEGGAVAGRYLAETLDGSGEVAIIEGISGHETADQRRLGFLSGIQAFPMIRVVASQTANWERALAYNVAENLLQAHPELDAIFAANDEMALGALEAVAAARRAGQIHVIGFDAIPDALANIRSGRLLGSVAQFPGEMGRLGVLHAVALLRDGAAPPEEILTRVEMIDGDNIDAFMNPSATRPDGEDR